VSLVLLLLLRFLQDMLTIDVLILYPSRESRAGVGFLGQLGRSATMTENVMDAAGDYGLEKMVTNKVKLQEQFLMPLPIVWADDPLARPRFVKAVACGAKHLLVLAQDEGESQTKVYSCGLNEGGQLGHGDYSPNRHALTLVRLPLGGNRRLR
jgi:alpha-tubulin suppressor-like RCC1 family protein